MKIIKLPRDLKKKLKKHLISRYPDWHSNEIKIYGYYPDKPLRNGNLNISYTLGL